MNKKYEPTCFFDETFLINYYVNYGTPYKEYKKMVKEVMGRDLDFDNGLKANTSYYFDGKYNIVWIWTEKKYISLLAHECFHAVYFAAQKAGIILTPESEESFAYQLQMLMRKILKKH